MGSTRHAEHLELSGVLVMAIADRGLPSIDPHTAIKNLIESNMASPDGAWTPVVNDGWLTYKKQKTYQICIQPLIGFTDEANLDTGLTQVARTSEYYFRITLFAPSRGALWGMMAKFLLVMNNGTLTAPSGGLEAGGNNAYQYARITRSDETKPVRMEEPDCGPSGSTENCIGYRADYTIQLRWGE